MFGFLSRRLGTGSTSSGTVHSASPANVLDADPSPLTADPSPLIADSSSLTVDSSPLPADSSPLPTDPSPLRRLIASVPPQTLHTYTLAHLDPLSSPDPAALTVLFNFFATLAPPPRLHCVRCHKGYFQVENTDRSCLVPHDDESAEVERVGASSRSKGLGTEYETLWGCCGKTVEGDGDMGPPDGWCYEGKHTTDMKRARFRADSTPYDDKLASCERLRCHRPPLSSLGATYSGANKRRRALIEDADNEDTLSSADGSAASDSSSNNMVVDESTPAPKPKRSRQSKLFSKADSGKDDGEVMDVDSTNAQIQVPVTPKSAPRPRRSRKSVGTATIPGARSKPRTPLVSSFIPPSPPADDNSQPQPDKAKVSLPLPRAVVEITTASDGSPRLDSNPQVKGGKTANQKLKSKPRARRNTVVRASAQEPY